MLLEKFFLQRLSSLRLLYSEKKLHLLVLVGLQLLDTPHLALEKVDHLCHQSQREGLPHGCDG